MISSSISVC